MNGLNKMCCCGLKYMYREFNTVIKIISKSTLFRINHEMHLGDPDDDFKSNSSWVKHICISITGFRMGPYQMSHALGQAAFLYFLI